MAELVFPTYEDWRTLRKLGLTEHSHDKVIVSPDVSQKLIAQGYDPDDIRYAIEDAGIVVAEDPDISLELITSLRHILIDHLDL